MSRLSSAILFQYNHPLDVDFSRFPPTLKNTAPKSVITRMGQVITRIAGPTPPTRAAHYAYAHPAASQAVRTRRAGRAR